MRNFAHTGKRNPLRIRIKFCVCVDNQDIITCATFCDDRLRGLGVVRDRISRFSIDLRRHPLLYTTLSRWRASACVISCKQTVSSNECLCCYTGIKVIVAQDITPKRGRRSPRSRVNIFDAQFRAYGEKKPLKGSGLNFAFGRYPGRNHVCNFLWRSFRGFVRGKGSNFPFSHWLAPSTLYHTLALCEISSKQTVYSNQCLCCSSVLNVIVIVQNVGAGEPPSTILIDGVGLPVEGVEELIYIGSKQSSNSYCRPDVLRRIGLACSVTNSPQRVWNCSSLSTVSAPKYTYTKHW